MDESRYCWGCKYNEWIRNEEQKYPSTHLCTKGESKRIIPEFVAKFFLEYGCYSFEKKEK